MTILCYHSIESGWESPLAVEPAAFAAQCEWLARRRVVLPLDEAVRRLDRSGRLPRGAAALTFDDGFAALAGDAFDQLTRLVLPSTVFVVAETLTPQGRPVDWVDTPPPHRLSTLTAEQLVEMDRAGVRVESHSYAHLDLTTLGFDACVDDLRRSRELLEDLLNRRVRHLAYPRGRHDQVVRDAARRAGYDYAFSLPEKREPVGAHAVPRVGIFRGNGLAAMRVKCARPYLGVRTGVAYPVVREGVNRVRRVVSKRG